MRPLDSLPALSEILERTRIVALPMRVRFRGITTREAALIEGPAGWGEFSPFLEYEPAEAAAWLRSGIEAAYCGLPEARREFVEVNGTIPAVAPGEVAALVERFAGCRTFKVKVAEPGQTLGDDVARVRAVRQARPGAVIRVDANRGWSVEEALTAAHALLADGPLDYLEQPCFSAAELAELRRRLGGAVKVAADESIRKSEDPYRVAELGAADVAVVKVAPLGGVSRVLDVAAHFSARGLGITIASALDTAVGMNAGLVAAAALPGVPAPAGLATQQLFAADVAEPRPLVDGRLPAAPVAPEAGRLEELAASPQRRQWWHERIAACYQVLQAAERTEGRR